MRQKYKQQLKQNKLNQCLTIPDNYEQLQSYYSQKNKWKVIREINVPNVQVPIKKQYQGSSFYDNFQFVDRLTNDKLVYRDARRTSNSMNHLKRSQKIQGKSDLASSVSVYKKTKIFQMESLKKKIFKSIDLCGLQDKRLRQEQNQTYDTDKNQKQLLKICKQKCPTVYIQKLRKKNSVRKFIDKTVSDMNKAELQRIIAQNDLNIKEEVIQINQEKNIIKSTMDQQKIKKMIHLRQKQQFQLGRSNSYKKKDDLIVFKQFTNSQIKSSQNQETSKLRNQWQTGTSNGLSSKRNSYPDNFMQKMMVHARSHLKRQCQYLVRPPKEELVKKMLLKKTKKGFISPGYRDNSMRTQNSFNLSAFSFEKRQQSSLVKQIKFQIQRNKRVQTSIGFQQKAKKGKVEGTNNYQDVGTNGCYKQKNIIYLLKNNLVAHISIQLSADPNTSKIRDSKGNNLIHLAVKHQHHEILEIILKQIPLKICRQLLLQKNNSKKSPKQLATVFYDKKALQIIQKHEAENRYQQKPRSYPTKYFTNSPIPNLTTPIDDRHNYPIQNLQSNK